MAASLRRTVTVSPEVLYQELEGEIVMLDMNSEHYLGLDEVGTRVWKLILEKGNLEDIYSQMLAEYDVDEATLRHDLTELIAQLQARGLVEVAEAT